LVVGIDEAASAQADQIKSDWEAAKADSKDCVVKVGSTVNTITQSYDDSAEKLSLFKKYAYLSVAAGDFADKAADQVWQQIQPQIDAQKPSDLPDIPGMTADQVWEKVTSPLATKTKDMTKTAIQQACDAAIAKALA
jgi:hypothetical protein